MSEDVSPRREGTGPGEGLPRTPRDQPDPGSPPPWQTDPQWTEPAAPAGPFPAQPQPSQPVTPAWSEAAPSSPDGFAESPYPRRIEPSPPPQRGRLIPVLIGLAVGALVVAAAGFVVGRATGGGSSAAPEPTPPPTHLGEVATANRATFSGELAALAEPWLTVLSGCAAATDSGGPDLGEGETAHVLCRNGALYVHFVTYNSAETKVAGRTYRQHLALSAQALLPQLEPPGPKVGGVTGASGSYVEYAFRAGADAPALCGVWWDLDDSVSAVYVDVLCEALGAGWDPLRAVWQRHS